MAVIQCGCGTMNIAGVRRCQRCDRKLPWKRIHLMSWLHIMACLLEMGSLAIRETLNTEEDE